MPQLTPVALKNAAHCPVVDLGKRDSAVDLQASRGSECRQGKCGFEPHSDLCRKSWSECDSDGAGSASRDTHPSCSLLLHHNIRWPRIQADPDGLQFRLHLLSLIGGFCNVHHDEDQICCFRGADNLSTTTETHRSTGNDTWKIEQLYTSTFKFQDAWNGLFAVARSGTVPSPRRRTCRQSCEFVCTSSALRFCEF